MGVKKSTSSDAVKDNILYRSMVLLAIKLRFNQRRLHGPVLFLSRKYCVKLGSPEELAEATTINFIAKNTSIPVPKIYCAFTTKTTSYILMQRLKGDPVGRGWLKRSEESKDAILKQIKWMVEEMRNIPPPPGIFISSVTGGPLLDGRIAGPSIFGPFDTTQAFHLRLREGLESCADPKVQELIDFHNAPQPPPRMTHGDLSSFNILADGDEVTGIIDWTTSGYYPHYWEYSMAYHVNPYNEFWRDEVDRFIDPLPYELAMEKIRHEYFGDY